MLRAVTRQQILEMIENSYFGTENYSVTFGDGGSDIAYSVRFLADPRFEFKAERWAGSHFKTTEAPGRRFLAAEEATFDGFDSTFGRLSQWLLRVREEVLAANPFSREILELRSQLDQRLASMGEDLSGFFSKEEAVGLADRLSQFEERLRELVGENADLQRSVESIKQTVEDLKDAAHSINRGTWFRMAGGRLLGGLKALSTSKEAREFALEAAKKLLLDGPK